MVVGWKGRDGQFRASGRGESPTKIWFAGTVVRDALARTFARPESSPRARSVSYSPPLPSSLGPGPRLRGWKFSFVVSHVGSAIADAVWQNSERMNECSVERSLGRPLRPARVVASRARERRASSYRDTSRTRDAPRRRAGDGARVRLPRASPGEQPEAKSASGGVSIFRLVADEKRRRAAR